MFITGLEIFRLPHKRGKHKCGKCRHSFDAYKLTVRGKKAEKRCPYCNEVLATVNLKRK